MHTLIGTVIHGDGYGRKIGFPTVNLEVKKGEMPPAGVYAGVATLVSKGTFDTYKAGVVVDPKGKVDAHLLGYAGDAYGKEVTLTLEKFLRYYMKFKSEEELIIQIKKDIEQC